MPDVASAIIPLHPVLVTLSVALLLYASLSDIAARIIPDIASLGLLTIGIVVRLADGSAAAALVASALVFLLSALCWRFGWLGGGDVKLLAACAWLVEPRQVPELVLGTTLAGGALACLYLALSNLTASRLLPVHGARSHRLAMRICRVEWWRIGRRCALPYGCAIAVATVFTLLGR